MSKDLHLNDQLLKKQIQIVKFKVYVSLTQGLSRSIKCATILLGLAK